MLWHAMLCYVMACYDMLRHAMPCYALLCSALLCFSMPCHAMPCLAMSCHAMNANMNAANTANTNTNANHTAHACCRWAHSGCFSKVIKQVPWFRYVRRYVYCCARILAVDLFLPRTCCALGQSCLQNDFPEEFAILLFCACCRPQGTGEGGIRKLPICLISPKTPEEEW